MYSTGRRRLPTMASSPRALRMGLFSILLLVLSTVVVSADRSTPERLLESSMTIEEAAAVSTGPLTHHPTAFFNAPPAETPAPAPSIATSPESFNNTLPTDEPPTPAPAPAPLATATTHMPTQLIPLSELPSTVDMTECRKHLKSADLDRSHWLNEDEYVAFVHQTVAHTVNNHTMEIRDPVWGHTLDQMPPSIQNLYQELNQGGAISIKGIQDNEAPPSLAQELYLMKVCIHTEILVKQILEKYQNSDEEFIPVVYGIPEVRVITIYSSFRLSNKVGITGVNLETGSNRQGLEQAYYRMVSRVVGQQVLVPQQQQQQQQSSSTEPNDTTRRRKLTVTFDPWYSEIYSIQDTRCSNDNQQPPPTVRPSEWCQTGYGKFLVYTIGEDENTVYTAYSQAVQNATDNGLLQNALQEVAPDADVQVMGAGATLLPPPPTPAPTPVPAPTPIPVHPHTNITIPEPHLTHGKPNQPPLQDENGKTKHDNAAMIFILAGVLLLVNCCIIGTSVYACWRNRNNADIDLGVYDDDPDIDEAYYQDLRAKRKSRMSASSQNQSMRSTTSSNAPTLEDIYEAQTPAPAPAPIPMPRMMMMSSSSSSPSDAQERERILQSSRNATAAPSKEEIESKLRPQPPGGSGNNNTEVGYEDDKLKVDQGEMV